MKNIPRIFLGDDINTGMVVEVARDVMHYLTRVMRRRDCLVFGCGNEYKAHLSDDDKYFIVGDKTEHTDPSMDITLFFAPIKRTDELINMATQMGVACFQPVITEYTIANHVNWERMQKIAIEAAEQSNRNSVPKIMSPVKFMDLNLSDIVFADERATRGHQILNTVCNTKSVLIGPEGGFSDAEFVALDAAGACGIGLGKTVLRAELAAVIAIAKVIYNK